MADKPKVEEKVEEKKEEKKEGVLSKVFGKKPEAEETETMKEEKGETAKMVEKEELVRAGEKEPVRKPSKKIQKTADTAQPVFRKTDRFAGRSATARKYFER